MVERTILMLNSKQLLNEIQKIEKFLSKMDFQNDRRSQTYYKNEKKMFCWWWRSTSPRRSPQYDGKIDEKELMPRVEPATDVRSGVLQFCRSCRSCSRAKEADWLGNIQLLSERQIFFFQTLNIPFVVDASPDQATRIFALVERAHWKKLQVQKKDIL